MNKSGAGNDQSGEGMTDRAGKTGQNEAGDIDEKTDVDQRSGDFQGGAQRQAAGQNAQLDQTGTRGVQGSAAGNQQKNDADNDQDIESDRSTQPGGAAKMDKNNQTGTDSNKDGNRQSDNNNKPSR